ncbi:MAG: geranylgeranylglycerol-phosphate geranylgeranyltransferase [Methanotrichaceae archaeon]|nr:geranylgeranylglycerol-phosphate geranylgeranyltransferase [Methanotrichaceae archaeon]
MKVLLEIQRPLNCLMAGAAAIVGLLIADGWNVEMAALIFLTAFLFTGAGNTINDYYDIEIDKINRPERPIPSGRLSPNEALALSITLFALGFVFAGLVNKICLAIAGLNSVLLFLYARNFKVMPLIGNICISYLTGSTFLFGGAVYGFMGLLANSVPFLLSLLITMSREIAKDIEDLEGDRRGRARTVPILFGERISSALVAIFSLEGIMLSYLAGLGIYYISIVSMANFLFLLAVGRILLGDVSGSQKLLKLGMSVALIAFFVGSIYSI